MEMWMNENIEAKDFTWQIHSNNCGSGESTESENCPCNWLAGIDSQICSQKGTAASADKEASRVSLGWYQSAAINGGL